MRKGALQNGANPMLVRCAKGFAQAIPPNGTLQWGGLLLALGFLLAAVGLAFGAVKAKNRADATGSMTIYLETPLSEQDLHALRKRENSMEFTAWGEHLDVTVADPDLGRRIQTKVLVLDGSSELVLPLAPVLAAGDTGGCLLGEETAWELFGSTQVTGEKVLIGNEPRVVRGVVGFPQFGVMLGGNVKGITGTETSTDKEFQYYNRITVEGGKVSDAEEFLMMNGLDGEVLRLDYLRRLHWITELVPGKWSDFSGWKNNITKKKEGFGLISRISKNSVELYYERQCRLYMWDTVMEAVCILGIVCICFKFKKRKILSG